MNLRNNRTGTWVLVVLALAITFAATYTWLNGNAEKGNGEGLSHFTVESLRENNHWGYRILEKGTPVIEQHFVPGIDGNSGFGTEQDALKIGELVKTKLDKGIFPPTVTKRELDSLHIAY